MSATINNLEKASVKLNYAHTLAAEMAENVLTGAGEVKMNLILDLLSEAKTLVDDAASAEMRKSA